MSWIGGNVPKWRVYCDDMSSIEVVGVLKLSRILQEKRREARGGYFADATMSAPTMMRSAAMAVFPVLQAT